MDILVTFIFLMGVALVLVGLSLKIKIPYPLFLIIGGAFLGFTPGLRELYFDPSSILLIVLPPALYYAAYNIPFKEFKRHINDILWLALGLVLITTLIIGILFKWFFPEIPWAVAFAFGAIISPPDAIAATAIMRRFAISPRLLAIAEGESLINDATALLLYRLALTALFAGTFSFLDANVEFIKIALGGLLVGLAAGYLFHLFSSHFFNPVLAVAFSFIIPYITYIIADDLQVSGVLAVVVCGLLGSHFLPTHFSAQTRVLGWASWDIFMILMNAFVFILIGIELHQVVKTLSIEQMLLYLVYGMIITIALVVIRFFWIYLRSRALCKCVTLEERRHIMNESAILSWSGMRGIVSLTAALALPYYLSNQQPLPGRELVILLVFIVTLLTLLIPGLTLSALIRYLKIHIREASNTKIIREDLIKIAEEELKTLLQNQKIDKEEHEFLLTYFKTRHRMLEISSKNLTTFSSVESARTLILHKKRQHLLKMWKNNEINDHLLHVLEREIDLEEDHSARAII